MSIRFTCLALLWFFSASVYSSTPTPDDFIAPPAVLSSSLSPDGKIIASVWNKDDARVLTLYSIDENKHIYSMGDNVVRPYRVSWANNERLLVTFLVPLNPQKTKKDAVKDKDFDINDYYLYSRLVAMGTDGSDPVILFNDQRKFLKNKNLVSITDYLVNDNEHILMSSYSDGWPYLFKLNVYTGESKKLFKGGRFTLAFVNDPDSNTIYRYDYKRVAKELEILKYLPNDEQWEEVVSLDLSNNIRHENGADSIDIEDLVGVKDQKLVYLKRNQDTGFGELITFNEEGKSVLASVPNTDIVGVITDGLNRRVIGYRTLKDVYRSHYFDEGNQKAYDTIAKTLKNENFHIQRVSTSTSRAMLTTQGPSNPFTYYVYDLAKRKKLHYMYAYDSLPSEQLAFGHAIHYPARDGTDITTYLYLPPGYDSSKAYPAVMLPHSWPSDRDSLVYSDFIQFIATRGYIVITPNFRGSSGYGNVFEEAGHKEWGGIMQDDLEDAVRFLSDNNVIDKSRVCIVGEVYGGYSALMGLVKTPDLYQCAISISGMTHLPKAVNHLLKASDDALFKAEILKLVGDPKADGNLLERRSPALQAHKITKPVLLIHGKENYTVPYSQSKMMNRALKKQNKAVKLIGLKDVYSNVFYKKEDKRNLYNEIEAFLEEHLSEVK